MDLTTLAVDAKTEKDRQVEAARVLREEQDRLNRRTLVRTLFKDLLGIDVADDDVIDASRAALSGGAGVIVDGHRLLLCPSWEFAGRNRDRRDYLAPYYLHADGSFVYLGGKVTDLPSLGRLLDGRLGSNGRDPFWEKGRLAAYYPGKGWGVYWRTSNVEPPEMIEGS